MEVFKGPVESSDKIMGVLAVKEGEGSLRRIYGVTEYFRMLQIPNLSFTRVVMGKND